MLCRTIFRFILFVPRVGALKVELYLVSFAIRDGEMTPCYFPSRVESWLLRWNVTVFQASGGSITSPFSGSIYSPSLLFLDQRKSELNSGQSRGIPCAIILSTHLNNVKKNTLMFQASLLDISVWAAVMNMSTTHDLCFTLFLLFRFIQPVVYVPHYAVVEVTLKL